ncbi:hypothetical protein ACFO5R_06050 [Halosolutus amylolyticus]|uniref:DUF8159 domain-containing protein n=1 Tax=Halosolutus amylolyticus TaxID=2932267 RepID=A0ABD5PLK4_9EURY|nr:hypothetical protein [Halosolutus amylolyticus]
MTDDSPRIPAGSPTRRRFLGGVAAVGTIATAGCLGSVLGSSPSRYEIDPEEPSEPREGTPGEFYHFLEENGIDVDTLVRDEQGDGDELVLLYRSDAETVEESDEEIMIVYQVYKQALIERGSEISFLTCEITNPFDGQAYGWGIDTEWIRRYDTDGSNPNETDDAAREDDGADEDETAGNDTAGNGIDMDQVTLWNNIMNSKVYGDDLEGGNASGGDDLAGADDESGD